MFTTFDDEVSSVYYTLISLNTLTECVGLRQRSGLLLPLTKLPCTTMEVMSIKVSIGLVTGSGKTEE